MNSPTTNHSRVLIMTAVEAEREAVLRGLGSPDFIDVELAGVGPASAAARTARVLAGNEYGLVISAGIGGGFTDRAAIGSIVIADQLIAADLGAETPDGFLSVDELGFGSSRLEPDLPLVRRLEEAMASAGLAVRSGAVLTVTTGTGSAQTAAALRQRYEDAAAEAMEGFGVAEAARLFGLPCLEIRTISNAIGPRDRSAWRMKEAFEALEAASSILVEVLKR